MSFRPALPALALLSFFAACAAPPAPLFEDLGTLHRAVTTRSPDAQRYFDQGLLLTYNFNHDEAVRSFEAAAALDPDCAMAWWGIAFALGPNINMPMTDPAAAKRAYEAARTANARLDDESAVERALVAAVGVRYADPAPEDRAGLDRAFADAMAAAWASNPGDADVGTLYADALLNLSPWDQWTRDGAPKENTSDVLAALEAVLASHPEHPGANHIYIHATEASRTPEMAEAAADRLSRLAPGAGHLTHMPSHTYIRIGRYKDAEEVNRRAVLADRAYFDRVGPQGVYELYNAHNHHFRAYAALFAGRRAAALEGARQLNEDLPPPVLEAMPEMAEGFLTMVYHVQIRFGLWEDVLAEPRPTAKLTIAEAMWHYARGVAFANTGRVGQAEAEVVAFEAAVAPVPENATIGLTPAAEVFDVARHMLRGEIRFRQDRREEAFAALRRAVELEDDLPYDEPKGWMQPVRHALGALLIEDGRIAEAEDVYRADLERHPENGWSLHGLAECLQRRGAVAEADEVRRRFRTAWSAADIELEASCFCREVAADA